MPYAYDVKKYTKMRNNEDNYNGKDNNSAVDAENKSCLKITPKLKTPMAIRTLMPER